MFLNHMKFHFYFIIFILNSENNYFCSYHVFHSRLTSCVLELALTPVLTAGAYALAAAKAAKNTAT